MLTVRLPNEVDHILSTLAENTGKTKSYYVKEAVMAYLANIQKYQHWQAKGATTMQAAQDALNGIGEFHYDTFDILEQLETEE